MRLSLNKHYKPDTITSSESAIKNNEKSMSHSLTLTTATTSVVHNEPFYTFTKLFNNAVDYSDCLRKKSIYRGRVN